jgi:hypothetical protein
LISQLREGRIADLLGRVRFPVIYYMALTPGQRTMPQCAVSIAEWLGSDWAGGEFIWMIVVCKRKGEGRKESVVKY